MTAAEVATYLRCSLAQVYLQAERGVLPCIVLWSSRRKDAIRFDPAALRRFLEERTKSGRKA